MTKRFLTLLMVAASVVFSGCNKDDDNEEYKNYLAVIPGMNLYSFAMTSNSIALDGVSAALRLAMFLEEAEAAGADMSDDAGFNANTSDIGDVKVSINNKPDSHDIREFLIGKTREVGIYKDGNEYTLDYAASDYHSAAGFDNLYRKGQYNIDTNGVALEESSAETPWVITSVDNSTITFTNDDEDKLKALFKSQNINISLYKDSANGTFRFECEGIKPEKYGTTNNSDWDMEGTISIESFDDFMVSNTIDREYTLDMTASGKPFGDVNMTYETTTPLLFKPFGYPFFRYKGKEEIKLKEASSLYAGGNVTVTTDGNKVSVEYGKITYTYQQF